MVGEATDKLSKDLKNLIHNWYSESSTGELNARKLLSIVCNFFELSQAIIYIRHAEDRDRFKYYVGYAITTPDVPNLVIEKGDGLVGQVALDGKSIHLSDIPDGYVKIISGLGSGTPKYLSIIPLKDKKANVQVIFEFSSFKKIPTVLEEVLTGESDKILDKILVC